MSDLFKPGVRRTPPELIVKVPIPKEPKKEKTPTYNLTWEQIQQLKKDAAKEAVGELAALTLGLPVMYMMDKEGWGKVRLNRMVDGILELVDSYEKGYITLEDVQKVIWDEGGTKIEKKTIWRTTK